MTNTNHTLTVPLANVTDADLAYWRARPELADHKAVLMVCTIDSEMLYPAVVINDQGEALTVAEVLADRTLSR